MNAFYYEPARRIPVSHEVDVVVAGGGTAGLAAAVCAARMGLSVVMVERTGIPGGMVTHVTHWLNDFDNKGGFAKEFITEVSRTGTYQKPYYNTFEVIPYFDQLIESAGVRPLYLAQVVAPMLQDQTLVGVIVESKSGRTAIRAKVVIDATGDGDIAARSGAQYDVGRPTDGACQSASLSQLIMNYRGPTLDRDAFAALIRAAAQRAGGTYELPYDHASLQHLVGSEQAIWHAIHHVTGYDATSAEGVSDMLIALRKQALEFFQVLKQHAPGFDDIEFGPVSGIPGIRESRRIVCDETVTAADARSGRQRPAGLFLVTQSIDIHKCTATEAPIYVERVQPYHVPLGALLPRGLENLMVVGRCIGGDHESLASYRIIADCFAMGEAAAIAAHAAIEQGVKVRQIDGSYVANQMALRGYQQ